MGCGFDGGRFYDLFFINFVVVFYVGKESLRCVMYGIVFNLIKKLKFS